VIQHLREPKFPLQWIMFTPDGERLVAETGSGGAPGQVVVWSVQDGTRISDTTVNDAGLYSEDISNDGRFLVIAPIGGVDVRLLDLATMSQVGVFYGGPTTPLFTIDISPSGDMLAGAGEKVFLWDLRSGAALGTPIAGGPDNEAYFSGDGGRLYVVSMSGQGWVIDVDPASWEQRACRSAGRTLTPREWSTFLPDRPYQPACEASPEP